MSNAACHVFVVSQVYSWVTGPIPMGWYAVSLAGASMVCSGSGMQPAEGRPPVMNCSPLARHGGLFPR